MVAQGSGMPPIGPAEAARRLGISIKALKLYERQGLVRPPRTKKGWRFYRAADVDRVSRILALKAMGFGLYQIGGLLDASLTEVTAALTEQEQQMLRRRAELDAAIEAVREASGRRAPMLRLAA